MKTKIKMTMIGLLGLSLLACSSNPPASQSTPSSGTSSGGQQGTTITIGGLSTLAGMPKGSDPVTDNGVLISIGRSISKSLSVGKSSDKPVDYQILSGMKDDTFNAHSSVAACEVSNQYGQMLNVIGESDTIGCFLKSIGKQFSKYFNSGAHLLTLHQRSKSPEMSGAFRINLVINTDKKGASADDKGSISDYDIYICASRDNGQTYSLFGHSIASFALTNPQKKGNKLIYPITMQLHGSDGNPPNIGYHMTTVTSNVVLVEGEDPSTLNGRFVESKSIDSNSYWHEGINTRVVKMHFDQTQGDISVRGAYLTASNPVTHTTQINAIAHLVDNNDADDFDAGKYDLNLLGIGSGAGHVLFDKNGVSEEKTEGWSWDSVNNTLGVDDNVSYIAQIGDAPLSDIPDVNDTLAFSDAEIAAANCNGVSEADFDIDIDSFVDQCVGTALNWQGYEWKNCHVSLGL